MSLTRRGFLGGAAAAAAACAVSPRPGARRPAPPGGMVASNQVPATRAGVELLRRGANAADAAVAVAAALAVTEPCSTGLGGDVFVLYYDAATREVTALNGSGRAPSRMTLDVLAARGLVPLPAAHAATVTVPGACAAWCDLLERHGSLSLATVLAPAIALAEEGFAVAPVTAYYWGLGAAKLTGPGAGALRREPGAERFRNADVARTLRALAAGGKDAFYRGRIAEAIVAAVKEGGGFLELDDLTAHASTWVAPISTVYRGRRVWQCPPNGQGLTALLALNILSGFDVAGMDPLGPDRLHLVVEALRIAFADTRWYVADPRFASVPIAELLDADYAARRRALYDPARAAKALVPGGPAVRSDTVYFCVVDGAGNACSFIGSNYQGFGTGIVPAGAGFSLQNRGANFSLDPRHPNVLAPRKRPYHTIIPGMLTHLDGALDGPFGVMGGFMQPQGHVQVLVAMLDDGLAPQAALDRPRVCVEPVDGDVKLFVEEGVPEATSAELARRGHEVVAGLTGMRRSLFGRGQIIRRTTSGLVGGFDPRGDGAVGAA